MSQLQLQHIYLTTLLSAALCLECLDELKGTTVYRQELKQTGNRFCLELEKLTSKDLGAIWGIDDEAMYELIRYQRKVIEQLQTLRPEDIGVVMELIRKYKEEPETMLQINQIALVDSSIIE